MPEFGYVEQDQLNAARRKIQELSDHIQHLIGRVESLEEQVEKNTKHRKAKHYGDSIDDVDPHGGDYW